MVTETKILSSSDVNASLRISTEIRDRIIIPNVNPELVNDESEGFDIKVKDLDTGLVHNSFIRIGSDKGRYKRWYLQWQSFVHHNEGDYVTFSWENQNLCLRSWSPDEITCSDAMLLLSQGSPSPDLEEKRGMKRNREELPIAWGRKKARS